MNTLMVLVTKKGFPPDIRVDKEAKALLSRGFRVYLLSGSPEEMPQFQVVNGIDVYRIKLLWSRPLLLSILTNNLALPFHLAKRITKHSIPIIHVHDLPYALIVSLVGRIFRKKIIYDSHESYVGMIMGHLKRKGLLRKIYFTILLGYYIFSERIVCQLAKKIIVVVEEDRNRLIKLNVPRDKVVVVSNTADVHKLRKLEFSARGTSKNIIISYVGGISYLRGLDTLMKAISYVIRANSKVRLLLVGDGEATMMELVEMSKRLGVEKHVTFTGWVPFDRAMKYMQESDIGVIPHINVPHTNTTVPHKLFQYMFYRKPVIVSDVKPLERIVSETGCGLVFQADNPKDLAEKLLEAISDASRRKEMAEKGRKAVETKYNWDVEQKKLISIYENLFSN